jgi:hypothetical protein
MYCYLNYIYVKHFLGGRRFGAAGVGARPQKFRRACRRSQNRPAGAPADHSFGGAGGDALMIPKRCLPQPCVCP